MASSILRDSPAESERRHGAAPALPCPQLAALRYRVQSALLRLLLTRGPSTIDPLRAAVALPAGTDLRLIGAAVRELAIDRLIVVVGRQRSTRPAARGRTVAVWGLACPGDALEWLADHPDFDLRRCSGRGAQRSAKRP